MALSVKVGSFTQRTSAGSQSVTGVGFQPKAIIFFGNRLTADGSGADACHIWGAATSATDEWAGASLSQDGQATTQTWAAKFTNACYVVPQYSTTALAQADFTSFDADGFTLNWSIADATARVINYIAIGGTDLTNAKAGNFNSASAVGAQSITGVGFRPDALLMFCTTLGTTTGIEARNICPTFSAIASTSRRQTVTGYSLGGGAAISDTKSHARNNSCFINLDANTVADFVSFDSDGFTLDWSSANVRLVFYVALEGVQIATGDFTSPTSAGNQAITGAGFQPGLVGLTSNNGELLAATLNDQRLSFGAGASASQRGCIWWGDSDNVETTVGDQDLDRTKIIRMLTEGTPTLSHAADLVSLDSDGFTLNWSTVGTGRKVLWWAIGPSAGGGGGGGGVLTEVLPSCHCFASTFRTLGNTASPQNLFAIINEAGSPVLVVLRKLTLSVSYTSALTAIESQAKVSRPAELPTGGTQLTKVPADDFYSSPGQVVCRGATASDGGSATAITATAGATLWQQFIGRLHSVGGQVNSYVEIDLIPLITSELLDPWGRIVLRPERSLLVQIVNPTGANNPSTNHYIVKCEWDEIPI